jgi:hypothetical protein
VPPVPAVGACDGGPPNRTAARPASLQPADTGPAGVPMVVQESAVTAPFWRFRAPDWPPAVAVVMTFINLARNGNPGTWGTVCAILGAAYISGIVLFSRRG